MSDPSVIDQIAAALRESSNPADRVTSWMCHWSLYRGQLQCSQCQAVQMPQAASEPFVHRAGCMAAGGEAYPWQELAALLCRLPQRSNHRMFSRN